MIALINILTAALVLSGAVFALIASVGLIRLPDVFSRLHAASKAGTLGSGLILLGLAIVSQDLAIATRAIAGIIFFFLTAPISSHLLARAAYASGTKLWPGSVRDDMLK